MDLFSLDAVVLFVVICNCLLFFMAEKLFGPRPVCANSKQKEAPPPPPPPNEIGLWMYYFELLQMFSVLNISTENTCLFTLIRGRFFGVMKIAFRSLQI